MLQFQLWKKLLVVAIAALGIIYALPNLISTDNGVAFLPGKKINLGLDLQGGSHLLLRVDIDAVRRERLENLGETLRRDFRTNKIRFSALSVNEDTVSLQVRDKTDIATAQQIFQDLGRCSSLTLQDPLQHPYPCPYPNHRHLDLHLDHP